MDTRTVGVEEELLVVDPATRAVTSRAREVLREHAERRGDRREDLDQELFRHQLETRTEPTRDVDDAGRAGGRGPAPRSRGRGRARPGGGRLRHDPAGARRSGGDRRRPLPRHGRDLRRRGQARHAPAGCTCTWRSTPTRRGSGCLDRIAPWLPVLLAVSANSPYADGADTGYASWRTQQWSTWPSAGPTEAFGSVAGYRRTCERMIASGAARDPGMLYFDARLSAGQPTLEVRVLDVVTDVDDVGLLAALVRALVETAAVQSAAGEPAPAGGARSCARPAGGRPATASPATCSTRPTTSCGRRARCSARWSTWSASGSRRPATPSGWPRGVERVLGATGASPAARGVRAHRLDRGCRGRRRSPALRTRGPPQTAPIEA